MGKRGPAKKVAPPPPPKPQGTGGKKRTPTSVYDPAAGKDVYEPEKVVGQRLAKGVTQYSVKWVGWESKHNTWEPIEHLTNRAQQEYLADPEEPDTEVDVLAWWKAKETKWLALAKMVKQYFAAPASSAGVERVFSAAGKMHGDLQKSAKDTTLEHSLFAAFNTE